MITYSTENVKFPNIKRRETTAWIRRVAATYGKKVGEVGYLFCDDEHILAVNREYLQHDYYTDITKSCIGSLSTESCTFADSTIRAQASAS